jgi:hypothetical protein
MKRRPPGWQNHLAVKAEGDPILAELIDENPQEWTRLKAGAQPAGSRDRTSLAKTLWKLTDSIAFRACSRDGDLPRSDRVVAVAERPAPGGPGAIASGTRFNPSRTAGGVQRAVSSLVVIETAALSRETGRTWVG